MDATKKRAYAIYYRALRDGTLVREEYCEICGLSEDANGRALIGHHLNGYGPGHELDVEWLCWECHYYHHGERRRERARAGLRTFWDNLTPEQRSERGRKSHVTFRERDPEAYREHQRAASVKGSRKGGCRLWHGPDCWDDSLGCRKAASVTRSGDEEARLDSR